MAAGGDLLAGFREALAQMTTDPAAAADRFEAAGRRLLDFAAALRTAAETGGATRSTGGMGDAVRIRVVGPDGRVKQETQAGA